ncbi:MAG: TetR family transcriptional regulator [Oscillospiraceae bacterium]
MPKQRFFKLSFEKKQRIINSAVKEMSRVPINEISINRIIQDANISRGSFYQYFEDKNDLVREVMSGYKKEMLEQVEFFLSHQSQDIFELFIYIFKIIAISTKSGQHEKLISNFFNSIKNDAELFNRVIGVNELQNAIDMITNLVDTSNYRYSTKEDLINLMEIISAIICKSYVKITKCPEDKELIFQQFKHQLSMIQNGILLKEKEVC